MSENPVSDVWEQGDAYERYIGRWSRQVAPRFLSWLRVPPNRRWLDVGCGTGALCSAILDQCSPCSVTGVDPSKGFLDTARQRVPAGVRLLQGSATSIPLEDASSDVVVSGLVLNFVPDQSAALTEMARVMIAGGTIGAYVWDFADKMELIRYFWDAAVALDANAARMDESTRFPICRPEKLEQLFRSASLRNVELIAIDVATHFASFDDYWRPFLAGQGPAPAYAMSLDAPTRARLREEVRRRLPIEADGAIALIARAWAVHGTK
jgi:ubiquinone/menaquinone biosynthesis C-methylase UbiE